MKRVFIWILALNNNCANKLNWKKSRAHDFDGCATDASQPYYSAPSQRVIEAPLYSQGWGRFFQVLSLTIFCIPLWSHLLVPYLTQRQAEEICYKESLNQRSQPFSPLPQDSHCELLFQFQNQYLLHKRLEGFGKIFPVSFALLYISRRLKSRRAFEAILFDKRLPVLYLRSFEFDRDDDLKAQRFRIPYTNESHMVANLELIGPVIAIGRPGEKLPTLGAARMYVGNEDWQTIALELMKYAQIVVIRILGDTPGIRWELTCARENLDPEKLALWFPTKLGFSTYAEVRHVVRDTLQVDMPNTCPRGFVTFNSDWHLSLARSDIYFIDDLMARQKPTTQKSELDKPPSALHHTTYEHLGFAKFLEQMDVKIITPPPFHIHASVWVVVASWSVLLLFLPGKRWSFGFVQAFDIPHWLGNFFEGISIIVLALSLAFIPYIRDPWRRLWPSLVFSTILVFHGFWIVARAAAN